MAQVTIDIRGNTSTRSGMRSTDENGNEGRRTVNPSANNTASPIQPDTRLVEDVRRAIIQQGAIYVPPPGSNGAYKPIIQQAERIERQRINDDITQRYDERRADAQRRMAEEYERIDRSSMSDYEKDAETIRVGKIYDEEIRGIDKEEEEERQQSNENLTRAIEELTDEIRRNGGNLNPNSFLSQLRAERQRAIVERDTAEDEETARQAAERVRDIDSKIKDVVNGGEESEDRGINARLRSIQGIMGINQIMSGINNRSLSSTLSGASQTVMSMLPKGGRVEQAGSIIGAVIALLGGATDQLQKSNDVAGLAALLRNEYSGSVSEARRNILGDIGRYTPDENLPDINEIGLDAVDFGKSVERRIRARGLSQDGVREAYYQEMLERVFSLNEGSLSEAGRYDRYGINATDAISNLITRLEQIPNSGISFGNYARVQEYLTLQQQLMSQYTSFTARPNYAAANRELEAMASMEGYTVNSNTANDLNIARNAIVNPQNDRLRAILYSTVEEFDPTTAGRYDLIERAINDPEKQGAIMREYFRKIQNMYGGTDTALGFNAFRSILPGMSIDQMDAFIRGITDESSEGGKLLASSQKFNNDANKFIYTTLAEGYNTEITSFMSGVSDDLKGILGSINNWFTKLFNEGTKVRAN